jgi:serralysin
LKDAVGNQFSIWNTDSNGSFVSYAVHSGNSAALKSLETSFLQDLNGDGTIGVANVVNTVIEALGSTSLVQINSNYYFNSISSGSGPSLKYAGSMVSAEQFAPYTPVGVEQSGGGYQLAFKNSGNDQFLIWNTDANGNFVSYSALLGSSTALKSLETSFQQDLNGDGTIGVPSVAATVIEALGSTSLVQLNGNYYFNSISSGSGPSLKYGGSMVSAGQFAPYTPVGVEQSGGGYQLVFKSAGSDQFSIWTTDANGNFASYIALSGSSTALKSLETSFQQDLNGDGTIGIASGLAPALVSLNFGSDDGAFLFKPDAAAGLGVPPIAEKFECSWWSPGNGINLGSKLDGVFESSPLLAEATLHPSFNPPGHDIKLAFAAVLESDFFLR